MSIIDTIADDYILIVAVMLLATLYLRSQARVDRFALASCIGVLVAVLVVTNYPATPHHVVLGTAVVGLAICLIAFSAVAYTRLTGRRKAA